MKPYLHLFFPAILAFSGCATVKPTDLDDIGKYVSLRQGVSTKRDVHRTFGQPGDVVYQSPPPAPSRWTYYSVHARPSAWSFVPYVGLVAGGVQQESKTATFQFDPTDRYTSLQTSKDSGYVNNWVGITRGLYRINTDTKPARVEQEMKRLGLPFDQKAAKLVAESR